MMSERASLGFTRQKKDLLHASLSIFFDIIVLH